MTRPPVPLLAPAVVSALLIGGAIAMTWYGLAIAADGSYFLVEVLGAEGFWGPGQRILANAARQSPVVVATTFGVTDTHVLTLLYGGGQLVLTATAWSAAIFLCRADRTAFVVVATTAALCAGSTWLFSVSENVLAVPLTVLVSALLWQQRAWHWGHAVLAVSASTLLIASYETAVVTGAVLAAWAFLRARGARAPVDRYASALVAGTSAVSVVVAFLGASTGGPGPTHAGSFVYYLVSLAPWPFFVGLAGVVALVGAIELGARPLARWGLTGLGCLLLAVGVAGADTTFAAAYEARGGASTAAFLVSVYLWRIWTRDPKGITRSAGATNVPSWLLLVPIVVAVVLMSAIVAVSRDWSEGLQAFRAAVDTETGLVVAQDVLAENERGALWDWTASSLSLIVRSDPDSAILYDPNPSYVPFVPSDAREQLPDVYTWRP